MCHDGEPQASIAFAEISAEKIIDRNAVLVAQRKIRGKAGLLKAAYSSTKRRLEDRACQLARNLGPATSRSRPDVRGFTWTSEIVLRAFLVPCPTLINGSSLSNYT